jgi:hypothetical protein
MAMRKYLVMSALGVCLLVLTSAATAFAGSSTYYPGKNSQGQQLLFSVNHTANGAKFNPFFTTMVDHCPTSGGTFTINFSFEGFQVPIKNGKFSLTLNDISDRFNWSGSVAPTKASGTEAYSLAGFDNAGGLQDCTTGTLTWTAKGLTSGPATDTAHAAYHVTITKESNGSVRFSITH